MSERDPRKLILEVLRKHLEGLTILSIAELTGLHRHTSTKYIHELLGAGLIFQRNVGAAKLCYLCNKSKSEEEKILKTLEARRSGEGYGIKILVSIVLLTFLLSETIILAYQNVSFLNETNLSGFSTINTSPLTESNFSNASQGIYEIVNETLPNPASDANETSSVIEPLIPIPEENLTNNTEYKANEILISESETVEKETPVEPKVVVSDDKFSINLDYPQKITRGETINLKTIIENSDSVDAKNVVLEWILPEGFEIVSGNLKETFEEVKSKDILTSEITVKTDFSTVLGLSDIKIVVSYED